MLAMLPLGVLSTGLAFVTWTALIGRAGASRGSVVSYLVPVVAVALGVLVLSEDLPSSAFVGGAAIVIGAILVSGHDTRAPMDADPAQLAKQKV
jgi:drug/metabolite transporter (DMT)-like permease